ncbi:hypothetical protein ACFQW6_03600 [Nocardioides sp. GCM10028917]|uniref:hypothetical protein n=1 Tax=Nocardioides sp. GCM10028917 TaxID=3273408 RepID=UPI0036064996
MTTITTARSTTYGCGCAGDCGCSGSAHSAEPCGCATCAWTSTQALAGLERTRFYPRQIVTPDDLTQDQLYFKDKLRRHNRLLHGWGLVCGLVVEGCARADDEGDDPCKVRVTSGYALDPYGNEIVVATSELLDLCKEDMLGMVACLPNDDPWCRPVETSRTGTFYLAVRYRERAVKPVHAPTGCSCKDAACENSRYRDEYEFGLLPELPEHYDTPCGELTSPCDGVDECPPCPETSWVLLATVTMKGSEIEGIATDHRRHVLSLAYRCLDCTKTTRSFKPFDKLGLRERLMGVGAATPDAVVKVYAVVDGQPTEIEIPVATADLKGKTALEIATAWASVPLFDTDEPTKPLMNANLLFAHSPMEGSWIIESAEDLSRRLGSPVIDTVTYPDRLKTFRRLFDTAGRKRHHELLLDNVDRLDAMPPYMLEGVSTSAVATLKTLGIHSLADLRSAKFEDPGITKEVRAKLVTALDAISALPAPS